MEFVFRRSSFLPKIDAKEKIEKLNTFLAKMST
jgi:hypothetical protein